MTAAEAGRVRRRAVVRLGLLAAALLTAGLLPLVTAGPLAARLMALPLLVAGLLVGFVAMRVRPPAVQPSAPPVERACAGCVCGGGGCALPRAQAGDAAASSP